MIDKASREGEAWPTLASPNKGESLTSSPNSTNRTSAGMVSGISATETTVQQAVTTTNATSSGQSASTSHKRARYFNLRNSERYVVLSVLDLLLVNVALVMALALTGEFAPTLDNIWANNKWFITLAIVWLGCANFFDCYSLVRAASTSASVRNTFLAAIATIIAYTLIPFLTPPLASRGTIFYFTGLAVVLVLGWRILYAQLFVQPRFQQRAVVVGAGAAGIALITAMRAARRDDANPYRGTGYEIVGFIDDNSRLVRETVEGIQVLGDNQILTDVARQLRVNEIILAITNAQTISDEMMNALLNCRELGLRVMTMATVYERLTGRVPIDYVGRDLQLVLPMDDNAMERAFKTFKRLIDFTAALFGIAAMGVAIVPIWIINRFTSPGPLFYKQGRVGQGGIIFAMYKFRSMRPDAERATGAVWARRGDDRITPAGKFMRKTRVDELPQFINVLKGEMSLIGPRPERPEFVNALALMVPYYRARHAVKPGITGWAQVKFGYGSTHQDTRIKLEYDLYYVKHASPMLDILIALQTPLIMLLGRGT
jgi:exopolysaccharide biosynthesis polyprenyl glycosylphosphotransferase